MQLRSSLPVRRLVAISAGLALLIPTALIALQPDTLTYQWARTDIPTLTQRWMFKTGG